MNGRLGARYGQGMKVGDQFMWPEDGSATPNFWTVIHPTEKDGFWASSNVNVNGVSKTLLFLYDYYYSVVLGEVAPPVIGPVSFPHSCPRCGSRAYVGLFAVEHELPNINCPARSD